MVEAELEGLNEKKREIELKNKIPPDALMNDIRELNQ